MDEPVRVRGRGLKVYPPPTWAQFWRHTLPAVVLLVLFGEWLLSWKAPLPFVVAPVVMFVAVYGLLWWQMRRNAWRWVERSLRGKL